MAGDRCDLLCLDLPKAEALRRQRLTPEQSTMLASRVRALADPTRLMLACALADAGELCVCDLSWIAERADGLVSHHLRQLRTAALARSRREGKMVLYSLTPEGQALLESVGSALAGHAALG